MTLKKKPSNLLKEALKDSGYNFLNVVNLDNKANLPTPHTENIKEDYKDDLQIFSDLFAKIKEIYLGHERQFLFELQNSFSQANVKFVNEIICIFLAHIY